jgi:hypothetical protein
MILQSNMARMFAALNAQRGDSARRPEDELFQRVCDAAVFGGKLSAPRCWPAPTAAARGGRRRRRLTPLEQQRHQFGRRGFRRRQGMA